MSDLRQRVNQTAYFQSNDAGSMYDMSHLRQEQIADNAAMYIRSDASSTYRNAAVQVACWHAGGSSSGGVKACEQSDAK
jgi:hypothetical protein